MEGDSKGGSPDFAQKIYINLQRISRKFFDDLANRLSPQNLAKSSETLPNLENL